MFDLLLHSIHSIHGHCTEAVIVSALCMIPRSILTVQGIKNASASVHTFFSRVPTLRNIKSSIISVELENSLFNSFLGARAFHSCLCSLGELSRWICCCAYVS